MARSPRFPPWPKGKEAFERAAKLCQKAGGQAGIALSDPFCVDRHRDDFRKLVAGPMDYVIGNVHEWQSLYQVEDLEEALRLAVSDCGTVICTRSGEVSAGPKNTSRIQTSRITTVPLTWSVTTDPTAAPIPT